MNARRFILLQLALCGLASAGSITLDSRQGLSTSSAGVMTVAITPHPLWTPDNPVNPGNSTDHSAVWISDADTGYGGTQFQFTTGTGPVVTIFDTFASSAGFLTLNVWADDTADVYLDGSLLMVVSNFQSAGNIITPISSGQHVLSFDLYQADFGPRDTFNNPFGLLFTGTAPAVANPEPGTWGLFVCGLSGLIWARSRKTV